MTETDPSKADGEDRQPPAAQAARAEPPDPQAEPYSLWQLIVYVLKLGTLGFGGPVALVGYMHRDLVERRRWITPADYKEGLTLAQLMPGPLAAQLAIYLGFVDYRLPGATLVGVAFVLPSFLMVLALGWIYSLYGDSSRWMQAIFYGVGPAVIGIIAVSAYKLTLRTVRGDMLLWGIYVVSAAVTVITESETMALFLGAGLIYWAVRSPPRRRPNASSASAIIALPLAAAIPGVPAAAPGTLLQMAFFFAKAGAFVFGSGLAIVPFLYGGVVKQYGWLDEQQFLDAVAVAMITPGPVVITVGFIGFLVDGFAGATVAAVATFLPCYLFTVIPAPYFKKHGKRPGIISFVEGVTAAAIGAIAGSVIVLGRRTLLDPKQGLDLLKLCVFLASMLLLARFKKLPEPLVVLAAALVGLAAMTWLP